jgi:hypothetical protein
MRMGLSSAVNHGFCLIINHMPAWMLKGQAIGYISTSPVRCTVVVSQSNLQNLRAFGSTTIRILYHGMRSRIRGIANGASEPQNTPYGSGSLSS